MLLTLSSQYYNEHDWSIVYEHRLSISGPGASVQGIHAYITIMRGMS